jgi:hypothetical protein
MATGPGYAVDLNLTHHCGIGETKKNSVADRVPESANPEQNQLVQTAAISACAVAIAVYLEHFRTVGFPEFAGIGEEENPIDSVRHLV